MATEIKDNLEFKGTKGEWIGEEHSGVKTSEGEDVFETGCGCYTGSYLSKEDADLIAAAPEMFNELKEILEEGKLSKEREMKVYNLLKKATKR